MQHALPEACPPVDQLLTIYQKVEALLKTARLSSDLEFTHLPSQIALAAFHSVDSDLTMSWLATKTALLPPTSPTDHAARLDTDQVLKVLEEIKISLEASKNAVNLDAVRLVDKRLKFCKNPEKDPTSALFVSISVLLYIH